MRSTNLKCAWQYANERKVANDMYALHLLTNAGGLLSMNRLQSENCEGSCSAFALGKPAGMKCLIK